MAAELSLGRTAEGGCSYMVRCNGAAKHSEKVHYTHLNPVRRGLVAEPGQWLWSSFRGYAYREQAIVIVNAPGSAKLKVKDSAA